MVGDGRESKVEDFATDDFRAAVPRERENALNSKKSTYTSQNFAEYFHFSSTQYT